MLKAIAVDSAATLYTHAIDVSNYNNYAWTTDGVLYGGKAATATGNPKIVVDYWVCKSDPTVMANWSLGNDSLLTVSATTVFNSSTLRFTEKAKWIKLCIKNLATGRKATSFTLGVDFYKRD